MSYQAYADLIWFVNYSKHWPTQPKTLKSSQTEAKFFNNLASCVIINAHILMNYKEIIENTQE